MAYRYSASSLKQQTHQWIKSWREGTKDNYINNNLSRVLLTAILPCGVGFELIITDRTTGTIKLQFAILIHTWKELDSLKVILYALEENVPSNIENIISRELDSRD